MAAVVKATLVARPAPVRLVLDRVARGKAPAVLALEAAIDAEALTRANADTGLSNRIGAIETDASGLNVTADGSPTARTLRDRFADVINVKDYGAVGDCVVAAGRTSAAGTDNSSAFEAAFSAAEDGDTVFIPPGVYLLTAGVDVDLSEKSIEVIAYGARFFVNANVTAFSFDCGIAEIKALSGNYTKGGTTLSVSAMTQALAKGEPFKIVSNAVDPANRDEGSSSNQYRVAEWGHAKSATTTTITLERPLRFPVGIDPTSGVGDESAVDAYTTTQNARVIRLNGTSLTWRGGTIEYEEGHDATPWDSPAFNVIGATRPLIRGLEIVRGYHSGIRVIGCYRPSILSPRISNLTDNTSNGQFGYGVANSSYGMLTQGGVFKFCRHGVTTAELTTTADETNSTRLLGSGRIVGWQVADCEGYGGVNSPFDSHHGGEDGSFSNLYIEGVAGEAFTIRGRNISARGIKIRNCATGVNVFSEFDSGDTDDDLWTSGKPEGLTTAILSDLDIQCTGIPVTVTGARRVLIDGAFEAASAQHQCIVNEGSDVIFAARGRFFVTDFDGAATISCTTAVATFDVDNAAASLGSDGPSKITFAAGSSLLVDLSEAADGSNALQVFNCESSSAIAFRGRMEIKLPNGEFSAIFSGTSGGYSADPASLMSISVDGATDNSQTTGASGKQLKFEFADGSGWWDSTGFPTSRELKPIWRDCTVGVTHNGTGSAVDSAYVLPKGPVAEMDADGHALRLVLCGRKTGTNGTATVDMKWGAAFNFALSLPATAVDWRIDVTAYMTGDNAQTMVYEASYASGGGAPTKTFARVTETVNIGATSENWRAQCTAASGDSIIFDVAELYGSIAAYGVT